MADLDVGTLSGKIELEDNNISASMDTLSGAIDALSDKFDGLDNSVKRVKETQDQAKASTEGVADSFGKLGERIVERLAIYEVLHGIFDFAKDAIEGAHSLEIMSDQFDISTTELQAMGNATREFGVDQQQLGMSLFQLQKRIAGGDESVVGALAAMGLSLEDVKGLDGEEIFLKVEKGLATLQGSAREAVSADLFGRSGMQLLAFSQHADEAMKSAKDLGTVISSEDTKTLSDFEVSAEKAGHTLFAVFSSALAGSITTVKDWHALLTGGKTSIDLYNEGLEKMGTAEDEVKAKITPAEQALKDQADAAKFMATISVSALQPLTEWQAKDLEQLKEMGQANAKNAEFIGVNAAQYKEWETNAKAAEEAAKKYAAAIKEMESAGDTWQDTLKGIDDETVQSVKYFLEAGVSQSALATAYGLTTVQVKAINDAEKAEVEGRKLLITYTEQMIKAEDDLVKVRISLGQTSLKNQEADDEKYYQERFAKGTISEVQFQDNIISIKTNYARKSEDLYRQEADIETQTAQDATNKQIAELQQKFDQGKLDQEDFEKAKADIIQTGQIKQEEISLKYDGARQDRRRQELADIQTVTAALAQQPEVYDSISQAIDAMNGGLDATKIKVEGLDGQLHSLSEEMAAMDKGGSAPIPVQTVTTANKSSLIAELQAIEEQYKELPGRAPGGSGATGVMDINGWDDMLAEQVRYQSLKNALPGFKDGGMGDFGDGTLVTLHGKEIITPFDKAMSAGGSSQTNHIYVNGTAADVARKVADEIMKQAKMGRQFGAA